MSCTLEIHAIESFKTFFHKFDLITSNNIISAGFPSYSKTRAGKLLDHRLSAFFHLQLCNADLLSVHTREENDFITQQLRKSSEVNKLWIGMSYKEQKRMWSWIDGSRYRYTLMV